MNIQSNRTIMLAGSRILVVEDDPFLAMEAREVLTEHGAEVIGPVPSVPAALAALAAEPPDAAVLDVNLRGVWSTPVAKALRVAGVPFVIRTGYDAGDLDDPALRDVPVLAKPASPEALGRALCEALSNRIAGEASAGFRRRVGAPAEGVGSFEWRLRNNTAPGDLRLHEAVRTLEDC